MNVVTTAPGQRFSLPRSHKPRILLSVTTAVLLAGCVPADTYRSDAIVEAGTSGPVRWEMQSVVPSTQPFIGPQGLRFSDELARQSGGRMVIAFVEPGVRVFPASLLDALRRGVVDAGFTTPLYLARENSAFEIFGGAPFGLPARDHYEWLREGSGQELHDALYAEFDLKAVPCVFTGPYGFGWFRNPLSSPADLEGLKMAMNPYLGARAMQRLGVKLDPMRSGAMADALNEREIDAAFLANPYFDVQVGLHDAARAARNYYYPSFYRPFAAFEIVFDLGRWNGLAVEHRRSIEQVCHENVVAGIAEDERLTAKALDEIRSQGVAVREVPLAIWAAARQAWTAVAEEESRANDDFRRIYREYRRHQLARGARGT